MTKTLSILAFLLMFFNSCVENKEGEISENKKAPLSGTGDKTGTRIKEKKSSCRLSDLGLSESLGSPSNIEQAISLVNALPRPTSLSCFIEALNRPLSIYLTSSSLSIQPAIGAGSPRVFIMKPPLIMSLATSGDSSFYLEFAETKTQITSLKGEIKFPVYEQLSLTAPYDSIDKGRGSSCRGCHYKEVSENIPNTNAYVSMALKPESINDVSIKNFYKQLIACDLIDDYTRRCKIIRALYDQEMPLQGAFSESTPTLYESLNL